ncbi:putative surface protein with fasciclin (FAS1) repeats [Novosphingobium sp. PhB165]|uniref:fasciclin domain-containing protein n=1 Tax=Novosphingobium sp. PhB165 TaxID=2485105 RepID=UPI00104ECBCE|nr:fasciclin domain-containing protein [Novosphingobium sp. PhB165]TCM19852.1 putative surface protein with fasciclin (FAS1) repeats [Novosphingobium sp. PhB165]
MRNALLAAPLPVALALALTLSAALGLAACSGKQSPAAETASETPAAAVTPASATLPEVLDDADGMQTMAEALKTTGIEGVFNDKGSYTLLAPEDDAFDALGDKGKALIEANDHAALAALVRNHMLTGYMTPEDIAAAIAASKTGKVTMPTLGGGTVTFSKTGEAITVTADDGSQATIEDSPVAGGSSIAIPVSGVLRKI